MWSLNRCPEAKVRAVSISMVFYEEQPIDRERLSVRDKGKCDDDSFYVQELGKHLPSYSFENMRGENSVF